MSESVTSVQPEPHELEENISELINKERKEARKRRSSQAGPRGLADIDFTQLGNLYQEFLKPWQGQDKGLNKKDFKTAMRKTVGFSLTTEELNNIFMTLDYMGIGMLKWNDYITSLSTKTRLRAIMAEDSQKPPFGPSMQFIKTIHREEIVRIRFIPRLSLYATSIDYSSGRYVMLGRDGTISVWTLAPHFLGSHFVGTGTGVTPNYYVDIVSLYPSTMLAITSTDRTIVMYEFSTRGLKKKYTIVAVTNCITCMDYWADLHGRATSLIVWGDTAGDVHSLELNVNRLGGVFDKDSEREIITRVLYTDLAKNKIPVVRLHKASGVHNDWVTAVKYIPENKAFISTSCSNSKQSIAYWDFTGKTGPRYYDCYNAVLCIDYSHMVNIIATGCLDCVVRIWDFFIINRPIVVLRGHKSPVTCVSFTPTLSLVISTDKNYYVRVFNYIEGTCIQVFPGPSLVRLGKTSITAFFFNVVRRQLVVANTHLAVASHKPNPPDMAEVAAHNYPVNVVTFSPLFLSIITACANAEIRVWDLETGVEKLKFRHYSSRTEYREEPWAKYQPRLEVSVLELAENERSIISGSSDGTINIWNFNTGVMLAHFTLQENRRITGLTIERNCLFMSSLSREKVYVLDLDLRGERDALKYFNSYQKDDVNCIMSTKHGLVATAGYDGNIIFIRSDTGHAFCRLNAGQSNVPMRVVHVEEKPGPGVDGEVGKCHSSDHFMAGIVPTDYATSVFSLEESFDEDDILADLTEDHSILRCVRIAPDKILVSDIISGRMVRIITVEPKDPKEKKMTPELVHDALMGINVGIEESANNFRMYESSVEVMLYLDTRAHVNEHTATILTGGSEGWIRAWSLHPTGGLRGQFLATESLGDGVLAATTDKANEYLFTSDSNGYIKIWDLLPYCNKAYKKLSDEEQAQRRDLHINQFIFLRSPFLRDNAAEGFKRCRRKFNKRPPPPESDPVATLKTPKLLNVFRAHMQCIHSLVYINEQSLILSGSKDCSVRLWTMKGMFVGHCGDPWLTLLDKVKPQVRTLPRDLRRGCSARSFHIIKCGRMPLWEHAVRVVTNYLWQQKHAKDKLKKGKAGRQEPVEGAVKEGESCMTLLTTAVLPGQPENCNLPDDIRLSNVLQFNWKDPKKSQLLGKHFKPNMRHLHSQAYSKPINAAEDYGQIAAFRRLEMSDITQMPRIPTPPMIVEMQQRRKEEEQDAQIYREGFTRDLYGGGTGSKAKGKPKINFKTQASSLDRGQSMDTFGSYKTASASSRNSVSGWYDVDTNTNFPQKGKPNNSEHLLNICSNFENLMKMACKGEIKFNEGVDFNQHSSWLVPRASNRLTDGSSSTDREQGLSVAQEGAGCMTMSDKLSALIEHTRVCNLHEDCYDASDHAREDYDVLEPEEGSVKDLDEAFGPDARSETDAEEGIESDTEEAKSPLYLPPIVTKSLEDSFQRGTNRNSSADEGLQLENSKLKETSSIPCLPVIQGHGGLCPNTKSDRKEIFKGTGLVLGNSIFKSFGGSKRSSKDSVVAKL